MLSLGTTVFDYIEAYAPGFKSSVLARDILTPPDLERIFGLPGGVSGPPPFHLPTCLPNWLLWALPGLH